MKKTTAIIIGGGQAGLSMSRELSRLNIDHSVLERGQIANAWRKDRWDSLRLLTPNWANTLSGADDLNHDPDGYMTVSELVASFDDYAQRINAPVQTETDVSRVSRDGLNYRLETNQGPMECRALVLATGAFVNPSVPGLANELPKTIVQVTPDRYKRPEDLPDGGVLIVGASATGVQLAREIQLSGRRVTLAVGDHIRLPRTYRGQDIEWWLHALGVMDERFDTVEDLERARRLPSPQLIGGSDPVDLNALQDLGIEIVGRLSAIRNDEALFSGGLANRCVSADLKMDRLLKMIDEWVDDWGLSSQIPAPDRPAFTRLPECPRLSLDLSRGEIRTLVWATGFRPDFSFLDLPVFDRRKRLLHNGGILHAPGLYVLGMPFQRSRQSHQISGVGIDATELATHLNTYLSGARTLAA
ncbi:MAG: NAD(P)-binding domain-containing protein [Pseudomonadota bacterium]